MSAVLFNSRIACPECGRLGFADENGHCECGYRIVSTVPPKRRRSRLVSDPTKRRTARAPRSHRGKPYLVTEAVIAEAYLLYRDHGKSLRQAAAAFFDQTGYRSTASFAEALREQWRIRKWPMRDRRAATATMNYRHGKSRRGQARDRDHVLELRRKRGEIRGVQCEAVKRNPPRAGRRCQRPALLGDTYCYVHAPRHQEELRRHLTAMRDRLSVRASTGSGQSEEGRDA